MKRIANLFAETPGSILMGNEQRTFVMHNGQFTIIKSESS